MYLDQASALKKTRDLIAGFL